MVASGGQGEAPQSKILSNEQFWVDNFEYLKRKGYQLRPRYEPGSKHSIISGEPALAITARHVIDAIRLYDNKKVCLKYMSPTEAKQTRELAFKGLDAPKNHAAPVFDFLPIGEEGYRIAVMPFLREFDDPKFQTVGEVLEAARQFLEGLEYIHSKNMAHRDACWGNMMMDASTLIPGGWHMARPWSEDGSKPITYVSRASISMKYHWIDFGLSIVVDASTPEAKGIVGQDRTVPEFKKPDQPYNPFKLDIYQLGNAFKTRLIEHYEGLDFLEPLVLSMTREEAASRPGASEALELFESATKDLDPEKPVTLKAGVRIWGSNPPIDQPKGANLAMEKARWLKKWFISKVKRFFRS